MWCSNCLPTNQIFIRNIVLTKIKCSEFYPSQSLFEIKELPLHSKIWQNSHPSSYRLYGLLCRFPVVVFPTRANDLWNLLSLYRIVSIGRCIGVFKQKSYPSSIDEGITIVIVSGMNFVILRVVPSILLEILYNGWYQNHICTIRFPTVFWYIEGTTPKIDLFQQD